MKKFAKILPHVYAIAGLALLAFIAWQLRDAHYGFYDSLDCRGTASDPCVVQLD